MDRKLYNELKPYIETIGRDWNAAQFAKFVNLVKSYKASLKDGKY